MHLDSSNHFHHTVARAAHCPHCGVRAHLTPTSTPDFMDLERLRPNSAGVVFHCDSCRAPIFRQYRIKRFSKQRIDFNPDHHDIERREAQFNTTYLPPIVAAYFEDALGCYRAGLTLAFATTCRLTIQSIISEHSDNMQLQLYDQIDDIASLAELDDSVMATVQDILFDTRADTIYQSGELDRGTAAILLEVMKDLLHQVYIRRGRLSKALKMRQFFARHESDSYADKSDDRDSDTDIASSDWNTTVTSLPLSNKR